MLNILIIIVICVILVCIGNIRDLLNIASKFWLFIKIHVTSMRIIRLRIHIGNIFLINILIKCILIVYYFTLNSF